MFLARLNRANSIYYGWILVGALSITETISYGILVYAFTVFIPPMQATLGWSKAELTGALSLSLLVAGLAAVPVGRWVDRYGTRELMTAGSLLAALLVGAWAVVDNLVAFYLIWIGLGVAMAAVLYEPAFVVIANWFHHKRSRALTVLTFSAGFASVIFIPLAGALVEQLGWRAALLVLAAILAGITIPIHAILLRNRPADFDLNIDGEASQIHDENLATVTASHMTIEQATATPAFWWLTLAFTLSMVVIIAIAVHLVPILTNLGYSAQFAAAVGGFLGTVALPGRLVFTPLGSRFSRHQVAAAIFAAQALGLIVLLAVPTTAGVWVFIILYGLGFGAITPARAALVAETYGATYYGRINGRMSLIGALARTAAPIGISLFYGLSNSYTPVLLLLALLCAGAAIAVLLAKR